MHYHSGTEHYYSLGGVKYKEGLESEMNSWPPSLLFFHDICWTLHRDVGMTAVWKWRSRWNFYILAVLIRPRRRCAIFCPVVWVIQNIAKLTSLWFSFDMCLGIEGPEIALHFIESRRRRKLHCEVNCILIVSWTDAPVITTLLLWLGYSGLTLVSYPFCFFSTFRIGTFNT